MKCLICEKDDWDVIHSYDKPDKYEKWMNIENVQRSWEQCSCRFYQSRRNYPIEDLQEIYIDGYRDPDFRHKTIEQVYQYIMDLPPEQSENERRIESFMAFFKRGIWILDIGSGLGVFPKRLEDNGYYVWCVEPNKESQKFINKDLRITCMSKIPEPDTFDGATLIHVLEHIVEPKPFLEKIKRALKKDGILYIEVPDDSEFKSLNKGHNEFSSDHVYFYSLSTLLKIIERSGFNMVNSFYSHYKDRNLTRLTMICQK